MTFWLIPVFVALMVFLGWLAWKAEQERRRRFRAWAEDHGWTYSHEKDKAVYQRYAFLNRLRQGHDRYAFNVLRGTWEGRPAQAFDFHFATTSSNGKTTTTHHHYLGVVMVRIERPFPEVAVHPESFLHRIGQALGRSDVDFESAEFSRRFEVRSGDKKLAYDFCNSAMIEYLLRHPRTALELEADVLAVYDSGKLKVEELRGHLQHLVEIRQRMPEYLFRD